MSSSDPARTTDISFNNNHPRIYSVSFLPLGKASFLLISFFPVFLFKQFLLTNKNEALWHTTFLLIKTQENTHFSRQTTAVANKKAHKFYILQAFERIE